MAYAFGGACDATLTARNADGVIAAADYADAMMTRYIVEDGAIRDDLLNRQQLKDWVDGLDPLTRERRGRNLESPTADLVLDATINAPKTHSIAALLDPELNAAYEDLRDRLRDRILKTWQVELNARRGVDSAIREDLARIEVVELRHERSRSLDPHKHRHLWLNVRVQGRDGKWSNIDSRVAMRFQNVVNAEGDLAVRTDPAWTNALAAKGLTLGADGEIEQFAHLVRPLSKRAAQIEANKATRTQCWKEQHPGQEPSKDVLTQIDRWAWAAGRPNKPENLAENDWAQLARQEVRTIDPASVEPRAAATVARVTVADLDLELLAAQAVVDADARSTGTGGRFSAWDVRAGAIRALAASGIVAERSELASVIEQITRDAQRTHTVALLTEPNIPAHVKRLMATDTAVLKATLTTRIEALAAPGRRLPSEVVERIAQLAEPGRTLDPGQVEGTSAIAGTARSVAASGPAGTGKTTMLKLAVVALRRQGRNTIIVAPAKKTAAVAGRETGSASSSLHQLLHDYGWRWATDAAGATRWTCLRPGDVDPTTGSSYAGPQIRIRPVDRIVVDEAGMLDLEAARALVDVLERTGAGIALVGDENQALPVGHSGAMRLFWHRADDRAQLTSVHRFNDPAWAPLMARLREPVGQGAPPLIADELLRTGHVALANSDAEAQQLMTNAWFDAQRSGHSIALVTATHAEAQSISEAIQYQRIAAGAIDTTHGTTGQGGQPIFPGDIVQTRRNSTAAAVQNRQNWVVRAVTGEKVVLASISDSTELRMISHEYAASHLHLGYASTVYGIQGETTDRALVGPGVGAAGLYVGLTRGRERNDVVLVAPTELSARAQLVEMMQRPDIEATTHDSRTAAREELNRAARPATASTATPNGGRDVYDMSR